MTQDGATLPLSSVLAVIRPANRLSLVIQFLLKMLVVLPGLAILYILVCDVLFLHLKDLRHILEDICLLFLL